MDFSYDCLEKAKQNILMSKNGFDNSLNIKYESPRFVVSPWFLDKFNSNDECSMFMRKGLWEEVKSEYI